MGGGRLHPGPICWYYIIEKFIGRQKEEEVMFLIYIKESCYFYLIKMYITATMYVNTCDIPQINSPKWYWVLHISSQVHDATDTKKIVVYVCIVVPVLTDIFVVCIKKNQKKPHKKPFCVDESFVGKKILNSHSVAQWMILTLFYSQPQ